MPRISGCAWTKVKSRSHSCRPIQIVAPSTGPAMLPMPPRTTRLRMRNDSMSMKLLGEM